MGGFYFSVRITHIKAHVSYNMALFSNSADKVVQGSGKFEELVVASHDIAASTAQLVSC